MAGRQQQSGATHAVLSQRPWAYNTGDNPGLQRRKYNNQAFVEMHGYDTYDIEWRQYYPAIMRFQTEDPEIEDAYAESPYAMCRDNMALYTDPDGRFALIDNLIGAAVGALTEYRGQVISNAVEGKGWSSFTDVDYGDIAVAAVQGALTDGVSAIGNVVVRTTAKVGLEVGAEVVKNAVDVKVSKNGKPSLTTNDPVKVAKNSFIGLTVGKIGTMLPGMKTSLFKAPTTQQFVKQERQAAKAAGNHMNRVARQKAVKQAYNKQKSAASRNEKVNKSAGNTAAGAASQYTKDKTDDKK